MIADKSALLVIDVQNQFVEGLPEEMKGLCIYNFRCSDHCRESV
jgi:isochorismate hydrolase